MHVDGKLHPLSNRKSKSFPGPLIGVKNCTFLSLSHLMVSDGAVGIAIKNDCYYITLCNLGIEAVNDAGVSAPSNALCHCIVQDCVQLRNVKLSLWRKLCNMQLSHKSVPSLPPDTDRRNPS